MDLLFLIIVILFKEKHLNNYNNTSLHICAWNDSIKMGELLIWKGAQINAKNIGCPEQV